MARHGLACHDLFLCACSRVSETRMNGATAVTPLALIVNTPVRSPLTSHRAEQRLRFLAINEDQSPVVIQCLLQNLLRRNRISFEQHL
jgi:hypothetical protein